MSKVKDLRGLVNQRLTAAAEEIFELFERTIAEYEEQLRGTKEKQHKLLDSVYNPEVQLQRTDVQQVLESKEERSSSPDQEDPPEPAHIKEEQEELWSSQEEEEDISTLIFTPVPVKREEDDGEKPQSSQLHEENRDTEGLKTEPDFNPDFHLQPGPDGETSHSSKCERGDFEYVWEETGEPESGLNPERKKDSDSVETSVSSSEAAQKEQPQENKPLQKAGKPFSCSVCGTRWRNKTYLSAHMMLHTKAGLSCSVCNRGFQWRGELVSHMRVHTGERPFSSPVIDSRSPETSHEERNAGDKRFTCPVCKKSFHHRTLLLDHMRIHTWEKCSCSVCGKRLYKFSLGRHMKTHTEDLVEKPFSCDLCGKRFVQRQNLAYHMFIHSGEKPFNCSVCGKSFTHKGNLKRHMSVHTGEKRFSCSTCGKSFAQNGNLKQHMTVHTGVKLFGCSVCGKSFAQSGTLKRHLAVHTGEEEYSCSVCHQRFTEPTSLNRHTCEMSFLF